MIVRAIGGRFLGQAQFAYLYIYICNLTLRLRALSVRPWRSLRRTPPLSRCRCQAPALCVSGPGALCVRPLRSLCSVSGRCALRVRARHRLAICVGPRHFVCQSPTQRVGPRLRSLCRGRRCLAVCVRPRSLCRAWRSLALCVGTCVGPGRARRCLCRASVFFCVGARHSL